VLADPEDQRIPEPRHAGLVAILETLRGIARKLDAIARQLVHAGGTNETYRHLITAPGYGPLLASAMAAMVIDPGAFRCRSTFAASLGLVPRHEGTGGKVWLGPISKRGNGSLRRLLVNGAMAVINSKQAEEDLWLAKRLASKPRKMAAVALANKMARIDWALMTRQEDFRRLPAAAAGRLARVNTRDGNVGHSGDREHPVSVIGASRPRRNDWDSIHGSHQGPRPCRAAIEGPHT
jgi:transposase